MTAKKKVLKKYLVYIWKSWTGVYHITIRAKNGRTIGPTEGFVVERDATDDVQLLFAMNAKNTEWIFKKPK